MSCQAVCYNLFLHHAGIENGKDHKQMEPVKIQKAKTTLCNCHKDADLEMEWAKSQTPLVIHMEYQIRLPVTISKEKVNTIMHSQEFLLLNSTSV